MPTNPDLVIRLRANSDDLNRGFRSAEAAAKTMLRELERMEAQQQAMGRAEAAAYREEAARNAKREADIRRMAMLQAQAYREEAQRVATRERQLEEIQRAEAAAYAEQARRNATRQSDLRRMSSLEAAAYREEAQRQEARRRAVEEVQRAERAAYAEQARRDAAAARAAERAAAEERQRLQRRRQAMGELGAAGIAMGVAIAAGLALSVRAAVEWESAWAGVTKTVNGSAKEMDQLEDQLRGLARSLPVSTTEIAGVAEAAGQLGIKRQDVAKFTQVMIGLGKATNLSSEEAATELARLMNIMGTSPENVDRLGATIVGLGNNFATTEAEISAMALRIAGAGKTIGLTEAQVYSIGAALSSVGIEAEAGGSAISSVFIKLAAAVNEGGDSVAGFANVAGMSVDEFSSLFRNDASQALLAFETGLGGVTKAGGDTFGILEDLGITEIRQRDAVLRLANAGDLLSNALTEGNKDWRENSALINEVNKRYATSASRFQIAKNGLNDMAIELGNELLPALTHAGEDVGQLAHEFAGLPGPVQKGVAYLGATAAAVGIIGGGAMVAAPRLAALGTSLAEMGARGAAVATRLSRVATVLTGPWGLAIAAATVAIGYFLDKHLQGKKVVDDLTEAIKLDSGALGENARNAVAAKLAQDGMLEKAKALGIPLNLVTEAAMGNAEAQAQLAAALDNVNGKVTQVNTSMNGARGNTRPIFGVTDKQLDQTTVGIDALNAAVRDGSSATGQYRTDLGSLVNATKDMSVSVGDAKIQASDYAAATAGMADASGEAGTAAAGAAGGVAQLGNAAEAAQDPLQGLADRLHMELDDLKKMVDGTAEASTSFINFADAYSEAVDRKTAKEKASKKSSQDSAKGTSDAYDESTESVKASFNEFFAVLEEQAKAQQDWQTNLSKLASRVPADFLAYLAELGPGSATLIDEMNQQTQEKLNETVDLYAKSGAGASDAWSQQLYAAQPLLAGIARIAGQKVADSYGEQLRKGEINVDEITRRWGAAIRTNVPDDVKTQFFAIGIDGAIQEVGDLKTAIRDLPNTKTVKVSVVDAAGNIRNSTVTVNPDGTTTKHTDMGTSTKYATGGYVSGPGGPTDDRVPALLSNGEFVVRAAATDHHLALLQAINRGDPSVPRYATGGRVGPSVITLNSPTAAQVLGSVASDVTTIANAAQQAAASAAKSAADSAEAAGQGTAASGGQGSGWQWQMATLRKAFPGLAMNSGPRPGAVTVSGNTSYHARGRAVDVPPRMDVFNWLLANYGDSPEIIFSPANGRQIKNGRPHLYSGAVRQMHFNHVHWAYRDGGYVGGPGGPREDRVPALLSNGEFVVNAESASRYRDLLEALNSRRFADGGLVTRATRTAQPGGATVAGQTGATGSSPAVISGGPRSGFVGPGEGFINGYDTAKIDKFLSNAMKPVVITIDDSALRKANWDVAQWTSSLAMANQELDAASKAAEFWGDEVTDAQGKIDDAQSTQERSVEDLLSAQKRLASAEKSLAKTRANKDSDADDLASANENYADALADVNEVLATQKQAARTLTEQTARLTSAQQQSTQANGALYDATQKQASVEGTLAAATEKATAAQEALNAAKAEALAYAQKIAATAMGGAEVTGLFSAEDAARALKYAQAAYDASKAEAQAATDAGDYQAKIDQLAAAGAKLATAQAAMGASYTAQKATIQTTRDEVEKLARSYGFTAQQARDLAESAVPLANTGETLVDSLARQLKAVQEFSKSIETLRALGLSQALIDQILEAGPEKGMALAQELIAGGSGMVKKLNDLQAQLVTASNALGQSAAGAVYGAAPALSNIGLVQSPQITSANAPVITRTPRIVADPRPIIAHRAGGGRVAGPGTSTSDSIPAYLSSGEFVIKAAAVARYGEHFFDGLNAMRFASGGSVASAGPGFAAPAGTTVVVQTTEYSGTHVNGPLLAVDTIRENVDMELLLGRMPTGTGPLGRGGGRS